MSVYNEPLEWIDQAIESILTQSFSDFEFIIINDKPNRMDLIDYLDKKAAYDQRIKILKNSKNIGLPASLNKGISISVGKYIARMDADDISLKDRFKEQVHYLETNPNIGICGTYIRIIDKEGTVTKQIWQLHKPEALKAGIISYCPFVHPTVIVRRQILETNKYDENCRVAQDWNLWLRLVENVQFANIPKVLFHYRLHNDQSQIKAGAERSRKSRWYADSVFADKLGLQGEIRHLFIKSRSDDPICFKDLDVLYDYLLKVAFVGNSKKYAMCKFISAIKNKCGIKNLFFSKTIKKNLPLFIKALVFYLGNTIRIRFLTF